jgi:putative alpha-1,2-mannosidase
VDNNKTFTITVKNNNPQNKYIQNITLNGETYIKSYILYKDLMAGGKMVIEMGPEPSKTWGVSPASRPYSAIR